MQREPKMLGNPSAAHQGKFVTPPGRDMPFYAKSEGFSGVERLSRPLVHNPG